MKKKLGRMAAAGALALGAGIALKRMRDEQKRQEAERIQAVGRAVMKNRDYGERRAYLIGGGLASLAAAAYLVRDCRFPGEHITVYESLSVLGGGNDGAGTAQGGFVCRGSRLLSEESYENFWELFSSIPSLEQPGRSVAEEIISFSHAHPISAKVRLADKSGRILNVSSMGFDRADRLALLRLMGTKERRLEGLSIQDWFRATPHFFTTHFWYMWQTAFFFQKWSSLSEFRRSLMRRLPDFNRLGTMAGAVRTPLNQYDSLIRPLEAYLREAGVRFETDCQVTDIDFAPGAALAVTALYLRRKNAAPQDGEALYIHDMVSLKKGDICIMSNGSMFDGAVLGDFYSPAPMQEGKRVSGELWARAAAKRQELGKPEVFFSRPHETGLMSFTVTCRGNELLKAVQAFSGDGGRMAFKDSSWLLGSDTAVQPRFLGQPEDVTVFWGYGLYAGAVGDYVKKPMRECTGQEILSEYLHHLHIPEERIAGLMKTVINVIPCYMPYAGAPLQPSRQGDRPKAVPAGSVNFAAAGQFAELPEDMAFAEEYSVRAARTAVYGLMDVGIPVCPVTPSFKDVRTLAGAVKKMYL